MILIAESGSTKTDWVEINPENSCKRSFNTAGINPYFSTDALLHDALSTSFTLVAGEAVKMLYFYGPGCSLPEMQDKLALQLNKFFVNAQIKVNSDLLAAGRGVFGKNKGIVCILGTGSNSGVYGNEQILHALPSLGFILGDEGSGAYMGKKLIEDFLNNNMPDNMLGIFINTFQPNYKEILDSVYSKPYPSRYLASFTAFLNDNIGNPYCQNLVENAFDAFFRNNLTKYKEFNKYEIKFVGSIAFYFRDILAKVASRHGVILNTKEHIIKTPLEGLVKYHSEC